MNNANGQMIATLTKSTMFLDYQRSYTEATGLPMAIRPMETWQLPLHGQLKENGWCAMMADKSGTCAACLQMQERLTQAAASGPCTMTCGYGLCETAVPIKLGSENIGYLQTGQIMRQQPTEAAFNRAVQHADKLGVTLENVGAREAFFATPVVSQKRMDSLSNLLSIFADHLSMKSNQVAVQAANAEPPVITKAKQFIDEHFTEKLGLNRVAEMVHTSSFYFCKLFKKATGINFTEYVSRVRTEKAKNLLLNPNLRVSEIAYEVGFQSLTHFNRVFKSLVGETPTTYRSRLKAA